METNVQEIFRAEMEQLRQEVIAHYRSSGRAASGHWASTVQVQELPNGFTLVADGYINGRGPGKAPPSAAIQQWITQKGIAARLGKEISVSSLAFLIARKIARMGWHPPAGQEDFITQVVTPARIQQIMDNSDIAEFHEIETGIDTDTQIAFANKLGLLGKKASGCIDLVRRLTISAFSMANVLNAINNGPAFTVNEKQSVWFAISVIPNSRRGTKSIYKYKMTGLGKGDYGAPNGNNSPIPLTAANLELVYYSVLDSDLIYQAPSTININLGTINLPLISSVINQRPVNSPLSFDSITERFTVLEATYNGALQRRLWVGGTGKYGQGAQQVTEDDLEVIPEPVSTPTVPTYTQVLNAGPLSNAYAIHYGSLNQNTTGYGTDIKYSNPDGNSIIVEFENPVATVKRIIPTGAADDYFALRSEVNKPVKQINNEDPNVVNGVYALTAEDTNCWLSFNNTIALTVHIPEEVFSAGTLIEGDTSGTAQVNFTAAPNVTLQQPTGELPRTAGQYSVFGIKFRSESEVLLFGRLELV